MVRMRVVIMERVSAYDSGFIRSVSEDGFYVCVMHKEWGCVLWFVHTSSKHEKPVKKELTRERVI